MNNKIWKITTLVNHTEQNLKIQPTPEFDGITLSFCEIDNTGDSGLFYINKEELPTIIEELRSMIEYIK